MNLFILFKSAICQLVALCLLYYDWVCSFRQFSLIFLHDFTSSSRSSSRRSYRQSFRNFCKIPQKSANSAAWLETTQHTANWALVIMQNTIPYITKFYIFPIWIATNMWLSFDLAKVCEKFQSLVEKFAGGQQMHNLVHSEYRSSLSWCELI